MVDVGGLQFLGIIHERVLKIGDAPKMVNHQHLLSTSTIVSPLDGNVFHLSLDGSYGQPGKGACARRRAQCHPCGSAVIHESEGTQVDRMSRAVDFRDMSFVNFRIFLV